MAQQPDLYNVLGVVKTASADEIKSAYRQLARKYHPDMNPGDKAAEDNFKQVSAAFDVLSDTKKRALYDEFGLDGLREGFDPQQARAYEQWGQRGGYPGGGGGGFEFDLGSIFGDLFGGRRGRQPAARGQDLEAAVTIDFLTALRGGELMVTMEGSRIKVKVPPGIQDGGRIRVAGKGHPGTRGAPAGNLVLMVTVGKHPRLERDGHDLVMKLPLSVSEAIRGGKLLVPTPDGGSVNLTIPPRSQNGKRLRLRGKGAIDPKGGPTGDLYVVLDVRLPTVEDGDLDDLASQLDRYYTGEADRPTQL